MRIGYTVQIYNKDTGKPVDVIQTNGYYGIVALAPGHISTINSTTNALNAGLSFTGEWEDITNFGVIVVSITSNVASATNGLVVQFSTDGTVAGIVSDDEFTLSAGAKKTWSFQAAAQYFRIIYTNGGTNQTSFNLQTILKPYYVKPSSHRIQDMIVDDDDAETTLNTAATAGDTSISVADTTGFAVGNQIKIEETVDGVGIQEIGIMTITAVAAGTPGTLTLDRPLGFDYTTAATVYEVLTNMAVNGTLASPEIFEIDPPPGTVWQFTRVMLSITDQTAMDDAKFGGITALTNGVSLRATTEAGRTVIFANWKSNADMKLDMYDVDYSTKAPSGFFGLNGRWTFTKAEVVAELDGDASPIQKLEVLIQDNLTDLDTFYMRGQGRVFSP
jgi:hypothetical protein